MKKKRIRYIPFTTIKKKCKSHNIDKRICHDTIVVDEKPTTKKVEIVDENIKK